MSHSDDVVLDKQSRAERLALYQDTMLRLRGLSMPEMLVYLEAACVSLLRRYYATDSVFTWEDDEDETRNHIIITTEYPRDKLASKDARPMIVVSTQGLQSSKGVINDTMQQGPRSIGSASIKAVKGDFVNIPMQVLVVSFSDVAAKILGGQVYSVIRTGGSFLREAFQLNSVSAPAVGPAAIFKEYPDYYIVPVSFSVEVLPKWQKIISEKIFQEAIISIRGIALQNLKLTAEVLKSDKVVHQRMELE